MSEGGNEALFNFIAPVYNLFYQKQKQHFADAVKAISSVLNLPAYESVLDVGCGTGALCSVLHEHGMRVTGVDTADKMLRIAGRNLNNTGVSLHRADASAALPFPDSKFDVAIASYVAHGLKPAERKRLYREMSRVSKAKVVIFDYNQRRRLLTSIVEWMERGDYFHFIKTAEREMKDCHGEMGSCFSAVDAVNADAHTAWYICDPLKRG